jgi:A/G-specific adenine glycosylase
MRSSKGPSAARGKEPYVHHNSSCGNIGESVLLMRYHTLLSAEQIREFREEVYHHYANHGRKLPWRKTNDPYKILISEIMLQQTQVARVIEKYEQFTRTFPDIGCLAQARLREILSVWQGLGYNRRALALKKLAEVVAIEFAGTIPSSVDSLMRLPGIGSATANAICAFAFNQPVLFIETNIRTVFIHHFFRDRGSVKDIEILPLVAQTLDQENPRIWYFALMDYGVALKKEHANPSKRSAHYQKQAAFKGSNRQIRGMILQFLVRKPEVSQEVLVATIPFSAGAVQRNLKQLEKEGLVVNKGRHISVA